MLLLKNKDIKGIFIENVKMKMNQFADDATFILDRSVKSLEGALNTLEVFGSISGLKMNTDKTQIVWIGKKTFQKKKLYAKIIHSKV